MKLATALPRPAARRFRSLLVLGVSLACAGLAWAQVPAPFVGTWKVTWQTDKRLLEAEMNVTPGGGTWQTATMDRHNPCAGREVPLKVESASGDSVQFSLQFSEVVAGCQNVAVVLKAEPDGKVTGTRSNKFALTLSRK